MNKEPMADRIAAFSYLWTSGEWALEHIHYSRARVIFLFLAGRPSPQELLAVRSLIPRFTDAPLSLLKSEVGDLPEFVAGEFGGIEARQLESQAHTRGLTVRLEDTSFARHHAIHLSRKIGLLIEDDELSALVTTEMLRQGVPVVSHSEVD
jgi:hypothetical protein